MSLGGILSGDQQKKIDFLQKFSTSSSQKNSQDAKSSYADRMRSAKRGLGNPIIKSTMSKGGLFMNTYVRKF